MSSSPFAIPPSNSGTASVTDSVMTLISGGPFVDGYPGTGVSFQVPASAFNSLVYIPPEFITGGYINLGFECWFIDSSHLQLGVDASYNLLLPAGTVGTFNCAPTSMGIRFALAWGNGTDVNTSPSSTIKAYVAANLAKFTFFGPPFSNFGGSPFQMPASLTYARIIANGATYAVSTVSSATEATLPGATFANSIPGAPPGAPVYLVWQDWGVPSIGGAAVLVVSVWANPWGGGILDRRCSGFSIRGGQTLQFSAQVTGNAPIDTSVTWSCSAGSITSGGLYTAPAWGGSYQAVIVTATSNQDGSTVGNAYVQTDP